MIWRLSLVISFGLYIFCLEAHGQHELNGVSWSVQDTGYFYGRPNVRTVSQELLTSSDTIQIIRRHGISSGTTRWFEARMGDKEGFVLSKDMKDIDDLYSHLDKYHIKVQKANEADFVKPFTEKGAKISVSRSEVEAINSAGGVDYLLEFGHLQKGKDIKYLTLDIVFYNAVGDIIGDDLDDRVSTKVQVTGPISFTGKAKVLIWDTVFYNSTASCALIKRLKVEYMGGSSYTYVKELPKTFIRGFTNTCP